MLQLVKANSHSEADRTDYTVTEKIRSLWPLPAHQDLFRHVWFVDNTLMDKDPGKATPKDKQRYFNLCCFATFFFLLHWIPAATFQLDGWHSVTCHGHRLHHHTCQILLPAAHFHYKWVQTLICAQLKITEMKLLQKVWLHELPKVKTWVS